MGAGVYSCAALSNSVAVERWPLGVFVVLMGLAWWWYFRRYLMTVTFDGEGVRFTRGRRSTLARWSELTAVRFFGSGVRITADGRTWRVHADLSGWDQFQRVVRDRASAEALAGRLKPTPKVRTKWRGLLQTGLVCCAALIGGMSRLASGQWQAGLVLVGLCGLLVFLVKGSILWYRFDEDALVIQRVAGRDRFQWAGLQLAAIKGDLLVLSFGAGGLVGINASQITRSPEEIFLSMQECWTKNATGRPQRAERTKEVWSSEAAVFWWVIVPVLGLIGFSEVMSSVRMKLGTAVSVCGKVPTPSGPCTTLRTLGELLQLDIGVLLLMAIMGFGIHCAGDYCNRHRNRLLRIFPPTLVAAIAGTILILVTQSALLAALLYYVPLEFANLTLSGLLIVVGVGLVLGLYQIVRHSLNVFRPTPFEADGLLVQRNEQSALWEMANNLASSLGAQPVDNILLGLEPNYFVTEGRICAHGREAEGRSLYLSLPATRFLTPDELRAIVGHEFGHFRGADMTFTRRFFPLFNSAAKALDGMATGYGSWTLLPAIYMLHFFLTSFQKVQSALSRDREFLADDAGVEVSSAFDLASALVKLEVFAPALFAAVQENVYTNRATSLSLGEQLPKPGWPKMARESLLAAQTPHPFDSHPQLSQRLENLNIDLDAVLAKPAACGADGIFEALDGLEARLISAMRAQAEAASLSPKFTFVPRIGTAGKVD